jgi:hypothetical protein
MRMIHKYTEGLLRYLVIGDRSALEWLRWVEKYGDFVFQMKCRHNAYRGQFTTRIKNTHLRQNAYRGQFIRRASFLQ